MTFLKGAGMLAAALLLTALLASGLEYAQALGPAATVYIPPDPRN